MMYEVYVGGKVVAKVKRKAEADEIVAFYRICHPVDCVWVKKVEKKACQSLFSFS